MAHLEKTLEKLRREQRKYAAAVARAPNVLELRDELNRRQERIASLEVAIGVAKETPKTIQKTLDSLAHDLSVLFEELRQGLASDQDAARTTLRRLFPHGVVFEPDGHHWTIRGAPRIEAPATGGQLGKPGFRDPTGT